MKKRYVCGFLFVREGLLMEKQKSGLMNGFGGVFDGDMFVAMATIFKRKTNIETEPDSWKHFLKTYNDKYEIFYFSRFVDKVQDKVSLATHYVELEDKKMKRVPNLEWIIPLALDKNAGFTITKENY